MITAFLLKDHLTFSRVPYHEFREHADNMKMQKANRIRDQWSPKWGKGHAYQQ